MSKKYTDQLEYKENFKLLLKIYVISYLHQFLLWRDSNDCTPAFRRKRFSHPERLESDRERFIYDDWNLLRPASTNTFRKFRERTGYDERKSHSEIDTLPKTPRDRPTDASHPQSHSATTTARRWTCSSSCSSTTPVYTMTEIELMIPVLLGKGHSQRKRSGPTVRTVDDGNELVLHISLPLHVNDLSNVSLIRSLHYRVT